MEISSFFTFDKQPKSSVTQAIKEKGGQPDTWVIAQFEYTTPPRLELYRL